MPLATLPFSQHTATWMHGWNFTTDLYLTLEYASNRLRARQIRIDDRIDVAAIFGTPASSSATVLASITAQFTALPAEFKLFAPPTGNRAYDIFGFQAANIQATLLLLRMIFLCTDQDGQSASDVQLKCNVAAELLAVFQGIPKAYLCGISTPLIYHLAGIGMILASVMERPLSEAGHLKILSILLSIADFLQSLESGLSRAADISRGLRTQVERIDDYMRSQRRPTERGSVQSQLSDRPSSEGQGSTIHSQKRYDNDEVHTRREGDDYHGGCAQVASAEGASDEPEGHYMSGWLGEFQLPPELLEDWPWSFSLQPESWSLLGTGASTREEFP